MRSNESCWSSRSNATIKKALSDYQSKKTPRSYNALRSALDDSDGRPVSGEGYRRCRARFVTWQHGKLFSGVFLNKRLTWPEHDRNRDNDPRGWFLISCYPPVLPSKSVISAR